MKSLYEELNGNYVEVGDVKIPALVSIDTNYEIGFWGQRHKEYLKQNRRVFITIYSNKVNLIHICTILMLGQISNMICLLNSLLKVTVLPNSSKQKIKCYGCKR